MSLAEAEKIECLRCGYDVRGLESAGACPECGFSVGFTLSRPTTLAGVPPRWARTLMIGAVMLFLSVIAIPVAPMVIDKLYPIFPGMAWQEVTHRLILRQSAVLASLLFHAMAVWILTIPEPKTRRTTWQRATSWATRIGAYGLAMTILEQIYVYQLPWKTQSGFAIMLQEHEHYVLPVLACLYIPVPALLFLHLRRLAIRIGRPRLAEHAGIVGVGLSSCFLAFLVIAITPVPNKMFESLIVLPAACGGLFVMWGTLLLVRMAMAFYRAIGEAREAWQKADAAAAQA